jgi:hypothetical protein
MPDIFTSPEKKPTQDKWKPQPVADTRNEPVREIVAEEKAAPIQEAVSTVPAPKDTYPKGTSLGLLSSFRMHPRGIKFVNQENDEHIILFIRRHFIVNVPWILLTILFLLLPIPTFALIRFSNLDLFTIPPQMIIIIVVFYYLVILSYALMNFIIWFYHVGIVTPKRLLDLDVYNILSHHLAETEIADIVDVSYAQNGFFQSFFNYGDVPIQTQAIKANFEFEASPRPAEVSDIITDLRPHRPQYPKPSQGGNQ